MKKELPHNWVETTLGEIAEWSSGGTPKRGNSQYYNGQIPWIKTGDLNNEIVTKVSEFISEEGLKNSSAKLFPKGSIGIAMYGATIGKTGFFGMDAATNQACGVAMPYLGMNTFVHYLLKSQKQAFIDKGKGGAQPNISQTVIKAHKIGLPPLPEQQRIVAKLDGLFAHLEEIKTRLAKVPELLKQFRQSVLTQAVTGKLTEEWRDGKEIFVDDYIDKIKEDVQSYYELQCEIAAKLGKRKPKNPRNNKRSEKNDNSIPMIPSNWGLERAEDLSYLITDGVHTKPNYIEEGTSFLSVKNVRPFRIDPANCMFISKDDHNQYSDRCPVSNGDILYTKVGATYGYAALVKLDIEFSIYVSLALIKPSRLLNGEYLELLFNSQYIFNQARNRVSGSGVPDLHLIEIRDFKIPVPPPEEQTEIVRRIESLFAKADVIEAKYKALKAEIENLPQAILAKAFKGELVEQLPTDGSAKELLEEIKKLKVETKKK